MDQSEESSIIDQQPVLSYSDLEIWHHYCMNAGSWFKGDGQDLWIHRIPDIGFKHPFFLHLVLSFSALHMARNDVSRKSQLIAVAEKHNSIGLRGLIGLLPRLKDDNYEVAMVASMLISFCYFGKGPVEGEYLLFNETGPGEWIGLLRGARSIMELKMNNKTNISTKDNQDRNNSSRSVDYEGHTRRLRSFVQASVARGDTRSTTLDALDLLLEFYDTAYGNKPSEPHSSFALGWPYRVSSDYADSVAAKDSIALIVFAHFTVLLRDLESQWFMQGWTVHVLNGVKNHVHQDHLSWIYWVQDQVYPSS